MKNLTWQNPEQLFVAQELINKVKSKCCGIKVKEYGISLYRALNPLKDIKAIVESIRVIKKEKPDIIHCHSAKGGVVGRIAGFLTGTKTFYTPHAFSYLSTPSIQKRRVYLLIEKMCRLNSRLLACSESEMESGMNVVGYSAQRAYCWHNSVPNIKGINYITPPSLHQTISISVI